MGTDGWPLRLYYDLKDARDRCRDAGNVKGALPWLTRNTICIRCLTAWLVATVTGPFSRPPSSHATILGSLDALSSTFELRTVV